MTALLRERRFVLTSPERLDPDRLPGTLDNYSLRFRLEGRARRPLAESAAA